MHRTLAVASVLACLLGVSPAHAAIADPNFTESLFSPGTTAITGLAWAPDGSNRLFFTRKYGTIRVIENGVLVSQVFAAVSPIFDRSECGLIGLAFDPNFVNNRYLYVFATVSTTEQQIIRYTANGNVGENKTVVMAGLPTHGINHDGGAVGIGPDGKVYWAIGDNGAPRTGIDGDLLSLAAKVGRANLDGSAPNDNPFFDGNGPNNDYVWARGFRNPFTFTWQPSSERLWVNVAGAAYEQIFAVSAGDHAGWDNYQANQPAGFLPPVISYRNDAIDTRPIVANGAVRQGNVARFTTQDAHRFRPGAKITVSGVADPSFDETDYVVDVPTPTQFTFAQSGPNITSGGGTAVTQMIGGAVTGGTFWDSSGVPATHRGNFFFGDYNSDRVMRATLNAQNKVTSVDEWATGIDRVVDMAVGPDGSLYYARYPGNIYRASYNFSSQGLVVSPLHVRTSEGGSLVFKVRLASAPTSNRAVTVARSAGDTDIGIAQGAALSFNASNWSTPQNVRIDAQHDADSADDEAQFDVTSSGLARQTVRVRVTDDESLSLLLSATSLTVDEGGSIGFQVSLSEAPGGSLSVAVTNSGGDTDVQVTAGATLNFNGSNWSTPQTVTLTALEDADATDDAASVGVAGAGLTTREVSVAVIDNDDSAPVITSIPVTTAVVGTDYSYDVEGDGTPMPAFSLDTAPAGMTIDPASGLVAWTPSATGLEAVVVRAANGVAPDATQAFDVTVVTDQPPTCTLSAPLNGSVIAGAGEEFFGDVEDDVGAVAADFYIDDALVYTDVNAEGHYHYNGAHNELDTTALSDGPHVLQMVGRDTAGQTCSVEVSITIANGMGGEGGAAGEGGLDAGTAGEGGTGATNSAGTGGGAGTGNAGTSNAGMGNAGTGGVDKPDAGVAEAGAAGTTPSDLTGGGGGGCACAVPAGTPGKRALLLGQVLAGLGLLLVRRRRRQSAKTG